MANDGGIPVENLSVQELGQLREQLNEELKSFGAAEEQLRIAFEKYQAASNAISVMKNSNKGGKCLIPLTNSFFVEGDLDASNTLMVEIGTGYYVDKTPEETEEFLKRKQAYVKKNIDSVEETIEKKSSMRHAIENLMRMKMSQATQKA